MRSRNTTSRRPSKVDWPGFFINSIDKIQKRFAVALDAGGCREAWLQAELYCAGRERGYDLNVNHHCLGDRKKADLSCDDPPTMLAEIKVVGAYDSLKMPGLIEADVQRMRKAHKSAERYMILVIRVSEDKTKLSKYLDTCCFAKKCREHAWKDFKVRIWRV